jgi:choline monooxygenase
MAEPRVLDIDPDVAAARTPPAWLYTDPDVHARIARACRPGWCLLPEPDPDGPHAVVPCDLRGEPAIWVRDGGTERLLSNVCTHRGALLVDQPCAADPIRCPYHGRRFRRDGTVAGAPGFDAAWGPADALPAFALGSAGPLRFGAVAPAMPFAAWWAPVAEVLAACGVDPAALRRDPDGDRAHPIAAPWLLYLENYLEGFHVPFVHPELAKTLDLGAYAHALFPHGTLQVGIAKEGQPALIPTSGPWAGARVGAFWFWLWPDTLVNVYPWGLSLNRLDDAGPGGCVVRYAAWVRDPSLRAAGAGGALDLVEQQDQAVVLRAWAGLRAGRAYGRGWYSPTHEVGLHHLHRLLAAALAGTR